MSMFEKWRQMVDIKEYTGAILMDLSKVCNTINHKLLNEKLNTYAFDKQSLLILSI